MTSSFSNLSLAEPLARAVAEMGYESMTPIQAQAIPVVLTGQDVMGAAQTGTGTPAAFSLPLLQRLLQHGHSSTLPAGALSAALPSSPGHQPGCGLRLAASPLPRACHIAQT